MPAMLLGDAGVTRRPMSLPTERGPLGGAVLGALTGGTPDLDAVATGTHEAIGSVTEPEVPQA